MAQKQEPFVPPKCCPLCGGTKPDWGYPTWFAHSLEELDLHNTAELQECQCPDCGGVFWVSFRVRRGRT